MKTRVTLFAALLILLVAQAGSAATTDANLSVTVAGHVLTASGLAPGSTAVFFGVALVPIPHAYMNRVRRWAVTVDDANQSGTVTLDLQEDVPPMSVWAVVDLRTAHYGTVGGQGNGPRLTAIGNPLRKDASQAADQFAFDHGYLELLYVQPGAGAWTWLAIGGSPPQNGKLTNSTIVSLVDGEPVGQAGQKPQSFLPGGILVAVDFSRLQIAVVPVDQQLIGGAP